LISAKLALHQGKLAVANDLIDQAISMLEVVTGGNTRTFAERLETAADISDQEGMYDYANQLKQKARAIYSHVALIDH
jgi:hypothetical protein